MFVCLSRGSATVGPGFAGVVRVLSSASFTGFVVVTAEELFAVAAAEQEDEAVDVVAQLLDAVSGLPTKAFSDAPRRPGSLASQ